MIRYLPLRAMLETWQAIPERSSERTVYVVSRVCRSVKLVPSVTTNCIVDRFVLSTVGLYTSESTPFAIVNQTFDVRLAAVPTQSLRARSKRDSSPGAPGADPVGRPTGCRGSCVEAASTMSSAATLTAVRLMAAFDHGARCSATQRGRFRSGCSRKA